jgi:hypothetical protein
MTDVLEQAILKYRKAAGPAEGARAQVSAAAFRSMVIERLRAVERDIGEVKARVNGLVFVVIGAVITQVVLRLAA